MSEGQTYLIFETYCENFELWEKYNFDFFFSFLQLYSPYQLNVKQFSKFFFIDVNFLKFNFFSDWQLFYYLTGLNESYWKTRGTCQYWAEKTNFYKTENYYFWWSSRFSIVVLNAWNRNYLFLKRTSKLYTSVKVFL